MAATMPKGMLEELLLVCTFVGTKRADDGGEGAPGQQGFVRGEDSIHWLQDLQRALRRDETAERAVRVTLGSWNVLQTKLLPLAETSLSDAGELRTLIKIFIMMTMPLEAAARDALYAAPDAAASKKALAAAADAEARGAQLSRRARQARLREAAAALVRQLCDARLAFAARPRVLRAVVGLLQAPLSRVSARRTDTDQADVELALTLVRNLVAPLPRVDDATDAAAASSLDALIYALHKELVLDFVCEFAGAINKPENEGWNLLLVEILTPICCAHPPEAVAAATLLTDKPADDESTQDAPGAPYDAGAQKHGKSRLGSALGAALQRESAAKAEQAARLPARHSRFGAVLRGAAGAGDTPGKFYAGNRAVAEALHVDGIGGASKPRKSAFAQATAMAKVRKKRKKLHDDTGKPVFNSDDSGDDVDDAPPVRSDEVVRLATAARRGPAADRARFAVGRLVMRLQAHGMFDLLSSVKNELRRDSSRVLPRDRHNLFALTEFVLALRRERAAKLAAKLVRVAKDCATNARFDAQWFGDSSSSSDRVASTLRGLEEEALFPRSVARLLDVFLLRLTLDDISQNFAEKRLPHAERSTALYKEMLRALEALRDGDKAARLNRRQVVTALTKAVAEEATDAPALDVKPNDPDDDDCPTAVISRGMLAKLFEGADPLDPLPALLRSWKPAKHTKRFACDVAEVVHVTTKLLEPAVSSLDVPREALLRTEAYVAYVRRLATPAALDLFAALLEAYRENADVVNHYAYSFLTRVARAPLADGTGASSVTPSSSKINSLEPVLYRVRYLRAFADLLADGSARGAAAHLRTLGADVVRHFHAHAKRNPILFIEALLPAPSGAKRFCDRLSQGYAEEEGVSEAKPPRKKTDEDEDGGPDAGQDEDNWDDEAEVDFEDAALEDDAARKRLKEQKQAGGAPAKAGKKRWTPREDLFLARIMAHAAEKGDDVDVARLARLDGLEPNHREPVALRRRIAHLRANGGSTADLVDKLAEDVRTAALKVRPTKARKKKAQKTLGFLNDAESESDDDDAPDDDVAPEDDALDDAAPPAAAAASLVRQSQEDADPDDDRWSGKRRPVAAASQDAAPRLKKRAAVSDEDDDEDDEPELPVDDGAAPAVDAAAAAQADDGALDDGAEAAPKPTRKRAKIVIDDDDE
ncbi:hypothetical protein M885DRAFT_519416 [Pelagophyceae sp. CCMP2097]|nr:hypothetical protein M885DRAFT_519416 [Pelagophyceae sp. CCMP2097]|mmetsp:Transcript_30834/g.106620  ORF Transcript_30834/g.106620 Transcript_30834/m.106620 type:complete len:1163 (-) Transcript_30834:124-3612(-)